MYGTYKEHLQTQLDDIKSSGLYKNERIIVTPQGGDIKVSDGSEVTNFCANNYLGLSSHPDVIQASKDTLDTHGYGNVVGAFYLWYSRYSQRIRS